MDQGPVPKVSKRTLEGERFHYQQRVIMEVIGVSLLLRPGLTGLI